MQRVKGVNIPKRNKQKFIEKYIKKAFKDGLTSDDIEDVYLKKYMNSKMKQYVHYLTPTKITHYRNNLFVFKGHSCITILEMPEKAQDAVDNIVYVTKLKPFTNQIKEKQSVKSWLLEHGKCIEKTKDMKRCIVDVSKKLSYDYLMNKFPVNSIKYIKNDSEFKKIIIKTNKKRKACIKKQYYFIYAMLLLIPKNQILKLQLALKNNKCSIFNTLDIENITVKQLDLAYKQLFIMLDGNLEPKYSHFNIKDNTNYDIIDDYLKIIIHSYINTIKELFKNNHERK